MAARVRTRPAGPRCARAAPRATATPACPDRYPSPAASGPRRRVPGSKVAGLGRRTVRLTSFESAQLPVPPTRSRPASLRSPASHATAAAAGAAPSVPSCMMIQAGGYSASGSPLTTRNVLASPRLTRLRRAAIAVTRDHRCSCAEPGPGDRPAHLRRNAGGSWRCTPRLPRLGLGWSPNKCSRSCPNRSAGTGAIPAWPASRSPAPSGPRSGRAA